ncbi:universal stress protein [Actinoplanes missouriensis]|uniref:universal stress protein n=1 Tax=Actinoplanes missouriensis TaxID=1866 RepID=UPI0033C457EE
MNNNIIVGYDGSPSAHAATTWALEEATRTGAAVELLYADRYPLWQPAASMVPSPGGRPESYVREVIDPMLDRAATAARQSHPLVTVTTATVRAHPAAALVERSAEAGLVVLGGHSHSALTGLFGSVTGPVSARAHCPVVVVRGQSAPDGPVVAGVDDTASATAVLTFAADQAAARKAPLHVIRAWQPVSGLWERTPMDTHTVTTAEREPFDTLVTLIRDDYPDLDIEVHAVVDHPAEALTRAGTTAQLLVVGAQRHGSLHGLLPGSVSRHLLHHAGCPLAVVPDPLGQS